MNGLVKVLLRSRACTKGSTQRDVRLSNAYKNGEIGTCKILAHIIFLGQTISDHDTASIVTKNYGI